ncbi:MAG TPA: 3-isopropylmalate dehydrogenase [Lentisphaeria bacterium]|nr:MAG: 3-isopropylmalate dehydrogenase [Lentisphaerae bacterium GWF2_38_69]HBM16269.1 3-isopropylmalate dehydrogenase [Lentisphaeria bacterium]
MPHKSYKIAVIPGDGIGPEVTNVAFEILSKVARKHNVTYIERVFPFGGEHYLRTGEVLSNESIDELRKYDVIYLGAIGSPKVKPGILEKGILLNIRFTLDQYINLRPVKLYPGVETPIKGKGSAEIDFVVVRENSGGLYSGVGGIMMKGTKDEIAINSKVYNYKQVERCVRYAFEVARNRPRKLLALVGKTNVLTYVFDLWERVFNELGEKEFPDVRREYYHVDAAAMHMIKNPEKFDVMVTTNMFGDILTDIGAVIQGGMGMASSGNINPEKNTPSMFEPVHGSAPDIAGQNKANPLAAVMTIKMMLEFLGENSAAKDIDKSLMKVSPMNLERMSTRDVAKALIENI